MPCRMRYRIDKDPLPNLHRKYHDPSLFNGQWFAVFSTVDKQTGVKDHYEVAEVPSSQANTPQSQWNWVRAVSPYLIKDQSLNNIIAVRAIDVAGNTSRRIIYADPGACAEELVDSHDAALLGNHRYIRIRDIPNYHPSFITIIKKAACKLPFLCVDICLNPSEPPIFWSFCGSS